MQEFNQIEKVFLDFFENECGLNMDDIASDTSLFSSGRLDSIDILKTVSLIEEKFGISVSPMDVSIEQFDTLALLRDFVNRNQS